ncbi:rrb1p [Saccharomyces arboricola H-6]|uniref:Rrb1p n=1 Tax=Saccharomyces arboricola (strain H-6 / AS 2.3317 / CBS 10644) TaxID=1160507 RepID=J8Q9I2_SACAR|nr:rrb1p [Saccharomyces arboricola H-6]
MSKRSIGVDGQDRVVSAKTASHSVPTVAATEEQDAPMNEQEGQLSDEFDSDGEIIEIDGDDEINDEDDLKKRQELAETLVQKDQSEGNEENTQEIYLPHMSRPLGPDEVLEADPTVYEMLHNVNMPWPCLTLDVIPDNLGSERRNYPQSILLTTATQSSRKKENELMVLALSNLTKTLLKDDDEEDEEEEEDDDDGDPVIENENIPLRDTTNRLKVSSFAAANKEVLTATMSENGDVYIYDLAPQSKAFSTPGYQIPKSAKRPIHTIKNHGNVEGYGLDWSPLISTGALLSGDCSGQIYFTQRHTSRWVTDKQAFTVSNNESIEDIQWSRTESTVFATAGCDGYIRIWDTRSKKHKPAISVKASNTDVNVISWSDKIGYLLASGDDNGTWGVWDLRQFTPNNADTVQPVAQYDFHKGAITSIAFNPLDESIVAVGSEDNTVTLWDLSVEADDEEIMQQAAETKALQGIPPQLLFVHWQKEVKDVKWHKQIPGCLVSTGTEGLNIWKTISV